MTTHATGTFEIKSWDEKPYEELDGDARLTRASVTSTFHGDIEGEGTSESLMAYPGGDSAGFVGYQRIIGRIGGRSGGFVLQVSGTYADGVAKAEWFVVPGSATDELRGLRGTGGYVARHGESSNVPITLDYELA
jgi:hypothetical protein